MKLNQNEWVVGDSFLLQDKSGVWYEAPNKYLTQVIRELNYKNRKLKGKIKRTKYNQL